MIDFVLANWQLTLLVYWLIGIVETHYSGMLISKQRYLLQNMSMGPRAFMWSLIVVSLFWVPIILVLVMVRVIKEPKR